MMTDEEFEKLMAEIRREADHRRPPPPSEQHDEYERLARHAEFGACAH
ncbi:hypothetical protein [Streptomyces beijiangensis]|uniref:Uncharacterized protein n=2 Tax=Streptomyces beijiangensis TaxID=163361 RepID=A0A939FBJ4_9ACTN|nr:hypothetical protein [Streptomyces beijiangensis]MBO0516025.1 hypothetical protein [Streptomyces beijiangensis]